MGSAEAEVGPGGAGFAFRPHPEPGEHTPA